MINFVLSAVWMHIAHARQLQNTTRMKTAFKLPHDPAKLYQMWQSLKQQVRANYTCCSSIGNLRIVRPLFCLHSCCVCVSLVIRFPDCNGAIHQSHAQGKTRTRSKIVKAIAIVPRIAAQASIHGQLAQCSRHACKHPAHGAHSLCNS